MKVAEYIENLSVRLADADLFYGHGTDNSFDEACYLVVATLLPEQGRLDNQWQRQLTAAELAALDRLAQRRIDERLPVAYLTGWCWFAGYRFRADRRALIPRSPIAELIINGFDGLLSAPPERILDLCCGGGCLGIAAARELPGAQVDLADVSASALALAEENIALHGVGGRVATVKSDLFEKLQGRHYDLILCNPPYVGDAEWRDLPEEFHHEPALGLVSADSGLALPLSILSRAADHLTDTGRLIMEVGYSYEALARRCPSVPFLWLEFEHGGEGVLMLRRQQLVEFREQFI